MLLGNTTEKKRHESTIFIKMTSLEP
jgi:hypothetical protein